MQSQEEDRQEKISKMTEKDRKEREKTKQKGYYVESKKNTIKLTENDLKRIISESVKRVLRENQYYGDMIRQIDINELIEIGNTCYEDLDIYRVSKKEDGILEIVIYNNSNGNEGRARIGLTGDIEEDYYYAIQKALNSMM